MRGGRFLVYADYVCPFCYLAEPSLARLRHEGVNIERRAFELRPAPHPLPDLRAPSYGQVWASAVQPLADQLGVAIRLPDHAVRTRKAHEAAAFARAHDRLEAMHAAIYHAYFLEGRDIGRIDVLVAIGTSVGLDATDLRVELDVDRWTERVEADEAEAAALGITGVPAFAREAERDGEQRLEVVLGVRDHAWLLRWVDAGSGLEGGR